jgi:hypothetical protein
MAKVTTVKPTATVKPAKSAGKPKTPTKAAAPVLHNLVENFVHYVPASLLK